MPFIFIFPIVFCYILTAKSSIKLLYIWHRMVAMLRPQIRYVIMTCKLNLCLCMCWLYVSNCLCTLWQNFGNSNLICNCVLVMCWCLFFLFFPLSFASSREYQPVRETVNDRGLFTAGWFGVREKYYSGWKFTIVYDQANWLKGVPNGPLKHRPSEEL